MIELILYVGAESDKIVEGLSKLPFEPSEGREPRKARMDAYTGAQGPFPGHAVTLPGPIRMHYIPMLWDGGMVAIDDGIDMEWIRSLTGKDRIEDGDIRSMGGYPFPTPPRLKIRDPTKEELDAIGALPIKIG